MRRIPLIALAATTAVLTLAGCSAPAAVPGSTVAAQSLSPSALPSDPDQAGSPATITTVGTGKVTGTPDVLTVTLGVETSAASAQEALAQNNTLAADVIEVLKTSGVDAADLKTSQLSVYPQYTDKNVISGYTVSNMVTATLHDIAGAGALIDAAAAKAGDAVRVQQLGFSIDDDSALRAAARAEAVKQAQAQAQQLADAAGVPLGKLRSVTEVSGSMPIMDYAADAAMAASAAAPIEAGSQELGVTVQVVYDLS